ncbi:MAG TPA: hemolysin III family protein [Roseiflexaceae bacterium]|nr:hemolysin III family protein [Roseiflexaceae bacterium]HMP42549.1 hemolysin III family protein [Roseiflexaceae bacterium]
MQDDSPATANLPDPVLSDTRPEAVRTKPLLRGWLHCAGAVGAVAATIGLLIQSAGDTAQQIAFLIFGLSMVLLYVVSSIYHLGNWHGRREILIRAFDHANIFVFIAGAYTPFCVIMLTGWAQVAMLTTIWLLAALGVAFSLITLRLPRWVMISLYIGMGWLSLVLLPEIAAQLSFVPVLVLVSGGLCYTVGALIYAMRWPDPFPRLFGYHELFHLLVVGGTVSTTVTIWVWLLPL